MALELEGKLIAKLAMQKGKSANGEWKKQDFVIETIGDYAKKVCFSLWGDKTDALKTMGEGEMLKVSFEANSREYNEKWYTDLRAWKIEKLGGQNQGGNDVPPPNYDDIPPASEGDDLPF
ncbi:MAG: DUF3127 domain-containing protein [Bacteroidales bacterium]|nr:DUF3127 domain-containing protein [Bacteroidales bacterium]